MIIAKVVGTVVSTRKDPSLTGSKFMIVEALDGMAGGRFVAVDLIGAGAGELVLVARGGAARVKAPSAPVDAVIVGIIDDPGKIKLETGN
ncbi:MAG: EutN/CcmL family microcompartment protein [Defluviitaleaceae bacterium]|nr:EutN/CcmL family microcompartment protein [Defluviitaleaceae bacterium]